MQVFFDKSLENEFAKLYSKFKSIEQKSNEAYQEDLKYLKTKLQIFDPYPSVFENEDFNITAIDGSGADSLVSLNDIAIHLMTAAFAADQTCFNKGTTKQLDLTPPLCTAPEGVLRLVLLREDNSDLDEKYYKDRGMDKRRDINFRNFEVDIFGNTLKDEGLSGLAKKIVADIDLDGELKSHIEVIKYS